MAKTTTIHHFPVGNGDMTLIKIASNNKYYYVLIDMHIRQNGECDDDKCDVLEELYSILETDNDKRPYIDVLILTHPDQDHIRGFENNFHTGKPEDYKSSDKNERDKIFVREIWSSPIIFRRKSKNHTLCDDAKSFNCEAKRRVNLYKTNKQIGGEGNRIRLMGKDENGKTDDIMNIVYENEDVINMLNEVTLKELKATVLAPLPDDEFEDGSVPDKNRSSIVIQWGIASHGYTEPTNHILLAGDAGVEVWEILWGKYKTDKDKLKYDILLAPHHCSWHTLSNDSISKCDDPKVSDDAVFALSEAKTGAVIISSSNEIKDDDNDPPCYKAKQEYLKIVNKVSGEFKCIEDHKPSKKKAPEVLVYRLTKSGPQASESSEKNKPNNKRNAAVSSVFAGTEAIGHG